MVPKPVEGWWSVAPAPDSSQIALAEVGDSTQIRLGPVHHVVSLPHNDKLVRLCYCPAVRHHVTESANLADLLLRPLFPLPKPPLQHLLCRAPTPIQAI